MASISTLVFDSKLELYVKSFVNVVLMSKQTVRYC